MPFQESIWPSSCIFHSTWPRKEIFHEFYFSWEHLQHLTSTYVDFATERIVPQWHFFSLQITVVISDIFTIRNKVILLFYFQLFQEQL